MTCDCNSRFCPCRLVGRAANSVPGWVFGWLLGFGAGLLAASVLYLGLELGWWH